MKSLLIACVITPLLALIIQTGNPPYGKAAKQKPSGSDFSKIVPPKVGAFNRISYKPPAPGLDGEATYRAGDKEVFMLFSKADTKDDLKETMQTIL